MITSGEDEDTCGRQNRVKEMKHSSSPLLFEGDYNRS